jgi:hypothetical protein
VEKGGEHKLPALRVLMQCPLVPLTEEVKKIKKALGNGLSHEQRKEVVLSTEFITSEFLHLCAEECIRAKFLYTVGRASCVACSSTWSFGTNSDFALGPRKTKQCLHKFGRSHDFPDAKRLLASSPVFK